VAVAEVASDRRVGSAKRLAWELLRDLDDRWRHTIGVAARAVELSVTIEPAERGSLVTAAWLHDIGYSPALADTGFHPLDGAAYLARQGWPRDVVSLVANHSGARFVADALGLGAALDAHRMQESAVSDALTYADQTVGPGGHRLQVRHRQAESRNRHGPVSAQALVRHLREPYLIDMALRVESRLLGLAVDTPVA
jgi:HD superfamily phosphodiesterase